MVHRLRRAPLLGDGEGVAVSLTQRQIERLIPHRPPFLLLDSITRVDLAGAAICGTRRIDPADPLLAGHFPGDPVYPGVLQIEMMGQLGLCLASLAAAKTVDPEQVSAPVQIRASRVHQTVFYAGVLPGQTLTIHAGLVENDELAATRRRPDLPWRHALLDQPDGSLLRRLTRDARSSRAVCQFRIDRPPLHAIAPATQG